MEYRQTAWIRSVLGLQLIVDSYFYYCLFFKIVENLHHNSQVFILMRFKSNQITFISMNVDVT